MIADDLRNKEALVRKFPELAAAFEFIIRSGALAGEREAKYEINENMRAVIGPAFPKKPSDQKLEVHKKYADLHYIIKGEDIIGWKSLHDCGDLFKEYDGDKDIAFFNEAPDYNIKLGEGKFALFFPEDAHSPLKGSRGVLKCIVKIKMELFQ